MRLLHDIFSQVVIDAMPPDALELILDDQRPLEEVYLGLCVAFGRQPHPAMTPPEAADIKRLGIEISRLLQYPVDPHRRHRLQLRLQARLQMPSRSSRQHR